jgi:hypothetical protein
MPVNQLLTLTRFCCLVKSSAVYIPLIRCHTPVTRLTCHETSSNFKENYTLILSMNGTVKTLTEKGFGFISRDGEEKDLFFNNK